MFENKLRLLKSVMGSLGQTAILSRVSWMFPGLSKAVGPVFNAEAMDERLSETGLHLQANLLKRSNRFGGKLAEEKKQLPVKSTIPKLKI